MRMQMTSQIDAGGNDPIFLMFHGLSLIHI